MADGADVSQVGLTKGARITGDQRSSLGAAFGERYAGGESIRSIAEDTGRSYGFVHGVLKESGASLRGRGGATRGPRRTAVDKVEGQVAAAGQTTASPGETRAKAEKDRSHKDKPGAGLVDKVVDKVSDKVTDKTAKAKAAKDEKAKKKAEPKKSGKKGKKG
jgi:hypothetical protein